MVTESPKQKDIHKKKNIPDAVAQKESHTSESKTVESELVACQASVKEWQEKFTRLSADFENFKRRIANEQKMWAQVAQADLLTNLLSIVDNFDRAMEHKDAQTEQEISSWIDGIAMIYKDLGEFFKKVGVKEVSYDVFDPTYHEALLQVDSDEHESGHIVAVLQKGYMLHDRVLRPAKVSVAK